MSSSPIVPYGNRVVAFVDILGFRSLVARLNTDQMLHNHLHKALAAIKSFKEFAGDPRTAQKELEASVFSDSIVITGAENQLFTVIWTCLGLQARLLALGVLTRGGISRGLTFHRKDILYGEGMIRAYDLETKAAIYPRIVVDPSLLDELADIHRLMLLSQDVDGLWHIDPFSYGVLPGGSEDLLEDGYDPHLVFLESFAKRIDSEIKVAKEAGHIAKWGWMRSKIQGALTFHRKHGKARFWRVMELTRAFEKRANNPLQHNEDGSLFSDDSSASETRSSHNSPC